MPENIKDLFKQSCILITGATGFIGKVLLEKIIFSCDVDKVYILIRSKNNQSTDERLQKMLNVPVFDRIKAKNPRLLDKIIQVSGDVSRVDLGLSKFDQDELTRNVNLVFHVASSIRFNEELETAIKVNVRGTRDLLALATKMTKLKSFVYVSSAFSNCERNLIEEMIYDTDFNGNEMIRSVETLTSTELLALTPKLLDNVPNTYCYTKRAAESLVHDFRDKLPVSIYRPSIVCYSLEEPMPGWIDTLNGQAGLALGMVTGVQHVLYSDLDMKMNLIPVDYCVNGCIAAAWYRSRVQNNSCPVFNAVMPHEKCTSIKDTKYFLWRAIWLVPMEKMLMYPGWIYTKSQPVYLFMVLFTHVLPGLLFDFFFKIFGIKFSLMDVYRKMYSTNELTSFFLFNQFHWTTSNYEKLYNSLSEEDKTVYNCSYKDFDLDDPEITIRGMLGIKQYILKEKVDEESLNKAQSKIKKLYWIDKLVICIILYFIYSLFK